MVVVVDGSSVFTVPCTLDLIPWSHPLHPIHHRRRRRRRHQGGFVGLWHDGLVAKEGELAVDFNPYEGYMAVDLGILTRCVDCDDFEVMSISVSSGLNFVNEPGHFAAMVTDFELAMNETHGLARSDHTGVLIKKGDFVVDFNPHDEYMEVGFGLDWVSGLFGKRSYSDYDDDWYYDDYHDDDDDDYHVNNDSSKSWLHASTRATSGIHYTTEPGHMSVGVSDFEVTLNGEPKVRSSSALIDIHPYEDYMLSILEVEWAQNIKDDFEMVFRFLTEEHYSTTDGYQWYNEWLMITQTYHWNHALADMSASLIYTATADQTAVEVSDIAVHFSDFWPDLVTYGNRSNHEFEREYGMKYGLSFIHENNAVDFSRNGGDPIARIGMGFSVEKPEGPLPFTMDFSALAAIDKSEQSMVFNVSMVNSGHPGSIFGNPIHNGLVPILNGHALYEFDAADLDAITIAIKEAEIWTLSGITDRPLAFAMLMHMHSSGTMCMDAASYFGDDYLSLDELDNSKFSMNMSGCMLDMGDMRMMMVDDGGSVYKTAPMSTVIGSGTSEMVGAMMYTLGDRIVHQTGTMQEAMMDAMDAAWYGVKDKSGIYKHFDNSWPPTPAPTTSCADATDWGYKGKSSKGCDFVAKKPHKYCSKDDGDDWLALNACPVTCGTCECEDSDTWRYKGKSSKGCDYVAKKPSKYCDSEDDDGTTAAEGCPMTCGNCGCQDSVTWTYNGKSSKDCDWVSKKPDKYCSKKSEEGVKAKNACRVACETCEADDY